MLAFGTAVAPPAQAHYHPTLHAPNVWTLPLSENSVRTASRVFADAILPHLESGIISNLETTRLPCTALQSSEHGRYFVMRAGSSTNERLRDSSDLSWISVDDRQAWDVFSDLFWSSGVAEAMAPFIDVDKGVQLYSSFFVVRSRCAAANYHTDWADGCGTNAFTLLAPLDDYPTSDFHLLYKCGGGREKGLKQYRYRRGEAIVFSSKFIHSTEPGQALGGHRTPHAFLCFTFGTDKREHWDTILPTIGGYQSRFLCQWNGEFALTEIGKYLRKEDVAAGRVLPSDASVFR